MKASTAPTTSAPRMPNTMPTMEWLLTMITRPTSCTCPFTEIWRRGHSITTLFIYATLYLVCVCVCLPVCVCVCVCVCVRTSMCELKINNTHIRTHSQTHAVIHCSFSLVEPEVNHLQSESICVAWKINYINIASFRNSEFAQSHSR